MEKKIKINEIEFNISFVNNEYCQNNMAKTVSMSGNIFVNTNLKEDIRANTLLHEIMHVIYHNYSIGTPEEEEKIVESFSNGLFAFLRQNQNFVIEELLGNKKDKYIIS